MPFLPEASTPAADGTPGEIRIPLAALLVPLAVILIGLGWLVSPRDAAGRPVLLTPGIRAVEAYRRQAVAWTEALRLADGETSRILADTSGDLLGRSQQGQRLFEEVLRIAREIDRQSAPPTLFGLREQLAATSASTLDSVQLALRWLSSPTAENETAARARLAEAQKLLAGLEKSQWLATTAP
ncbi:MAG: hypothetical protein ACOYYS_17680 [Chloroflexota bacterium]